MSTAAPRTAIAIRDERLAKRVDEVLRRVSTETFWAKGRPRSGSVPRQLERDEPGSRRRWTVGCATAAR